MRERRSPAGMARCLVMFALGLWSMATAVAATPEPMAPHQPGTIPMTVQDLHFGDVLYELFQGHDFEALSRDLQYSGTGRIASQPADARLIEAGLWLALGFHDEAGARLETIMRAPLSESSRNRARLYLARIWYHRGYDQESERLLREMTAVPAEDEAERVHLLSNILLRSGRYAAAAELLRGWQGPDDWVPYARFNLGVALLRDGQLAAGRSFLDELGALKSDDPERLGLKDRANLALGFALLEADRAADAKPFFDRVRLAGPYASRALLGAGWVDAKRGDYRAALTPWLALTERSSIDTAVLEGAVAVPRAFHQLHADAQAAEYYERSLTLFAAERDRIDQAIGRVAEPARFRTILDASVNDGSDAWIAPLVAEPDAPESRYLFPIFAGADFQQGFRVYRELCFLETILTGWQDDVVDSEQILATRREALDERVRRVGAVLDSVSGSPAELVEARTATERAVQDARATDAAFAGRLAQVSGQRLELLKRLSELRLAEVHALQVLARAALDAQRLRLTEYELHARYNLAVIYDHAATDKAPAKAPAKEPR